MTNSNDRPLGYVTEEDIEAMRMDRTQISGKTGPEQARAILAEGSPGAAMQLVKLALYGETENIKLRASALVLDKTLAQDTGNGSEDPWDDLARQMAEAERASKKQGK
jgi:hypothetical protein